jgi:hypothetical protein
MRNTAVVFVVALLAAACGASDAADSGAADPTAPVDSSAVEPTSPVEPLGAGPYPVATLDVTVTHPDADDLAYTISCLGDTATLIGDAPIDAEQACTALTETEVRSRLVDGASIDRMCTEIYGGPDVATIVGTFDDDVVDTTADRANGCGIDEWDRLFAEILPPATGITEGS